MSRDSNRMNDLTLKELELFLLASRTQSFREVARQWEMQAAHVSKVMKKIEEKMGVRLFRRSVSGVTLTPEALELVKTAEQICELAQEMKAGPKQMATDQDPLWTIGSISFLTTYLIAPALDRLRKKTKRRSRYRLVEFTHNDLVAHGLKGAFEVGLHIGSLEWTNAWESVHVGKLAWKLYGRQDHPLGASCTESEVIAYPFIVPTDWNNSGYSIGSDHCPLPVRRRRKGDEAATAETALELCRLNDQLTFIPEILAQGWCNLGELKEIAVKDWARVERDIYVTVKADIVPRWLLESLSQDIKSSLKLL